jgi:hypothetical protein
MYRFAYRMRTTLLAQRSYLPCVRCFRLRPPNLKLQGGRARRNRRLPHNPHQFCKPMTRRLTKWPSARHAFGGRDQDQSQRLWAARGRYQQPGDRETTGDWFGRDGFCGWIHYYQQPRGGWCTADPSHPGACYCGTRHLPHQPRPPATSL